MPALKYVMWAKTHRGVRSFKIGSTKYHIRSEEEDGRVGKWVLCGRPIPTSMVTYASDPSATHTPVCSTCLRVQFETTP